MNDTWKPDPVFHHFPSRTSALILQLLVTSLGIITNSLLFYAHLKDPYKILRRSSSHFIINLAIIDFLASCTLFAFSVLRFDVVSLRIAHTLTVGLHWFLAVCTTASVSSFLCLAVERFISIAHPLWYRVNITKQVYRYWIGILWLVVVSFEAIQRAFYYNYLLTFGFVRVGFLLTGFLAANLLYLASYISVKRQRRDVCARSTLSESNKQAIQARLKNEKSFLSTIAIVCFIFALTFLPLLLFMFHLHMVEIGQSVGYLNDVVESFETWIIAVISLNFTVNAFIYVWRWPKYRNTFKKLYCNKYICNS